MPAGLCQKRHTTLGILDLPAYVIVLRPDCHAKLTLDFNASHQSEDKVFSRDTLLGLCICKQSARNWSVSAISTRRTLTLVDEMCSPSRVDNGGQMGVIVVVNMRSNTVNQCSMLCISLLSATMAK
jgi:hypothetical protein